jgi:hypothetical protein
MKLTRIILSLLLNIGQESSAKGTERVGLQKEQKWMVAIEAETEERFSATLQ